MPTPALTPEQMQEAVDTLALHGGKVTEAANALNLDRRTFQHRVKRARNEGFHNNLKVTGTSVLTDAEGNEVMRWVKTSTDKAQQENAFREAVKALCEEIEPTTPVKAPEATDGQLCACYPVGDHHFGMLAWREETGEDYDISRGEDLLLGAMSHLVRSVPACEEAAIILLGDFLHYDSFEAVTPTNKHLLDADSRFPRMVRAAIKSVRQMVRMALEKHRRVRVIVEIGNHDLSSSIFLMEALANLYDQEPRVEVDNSPKHFHYFQFGKCLVATHHGHGVKADKLPLLMATDQPEMWGNTEYRYWYTGHVHHDSVKDYNGCRVESFRILPPVDAYAANAGYRSGRDMKAVILHRDFGEVARHIINPAMLENAA